MGDVCSTCGSGFHEIEDCDSPSSSTIRRNMKEQKPVFYPMSIEKVDYGPSWGVIGFLIIIGFVSEIVILLTV